MENKLDSRYPAVAGFWNDGRFVLCKAIKQTENIEMPSLGGMASLVVGFTL